VQFLGVQTLTTGVIRAWSSYGAPGAAARLSLMLMGAAILMMWLERASRRDRRFGGGSARFRTLEPRPLSGFGALSASLYCATLLGLALALPAAWLAIKAAAALPDIDRFLRAATHSMTLATAGAAITVALAGVLALAARRARLSARLVSLGYATPGAVMAIGLLAPAALIWRTTPGAVSSLAIGAALLIYAYAARLMAAALEPLDAGLSQVTPSMERAARTLGETEPGTLWRIHTPLARGAALTALLLVFVDILKELPATVILRPFNLDTLAVMAHAYAADERLTQAAWPSLMLVVLAAGPVAYISRKIARSRPGARP
jgi:iron(III) transport system permease protein